MKDLRIRINKLKVFYLLILGIAFSIFIVIAYLNVQVKKQIAAINLNFSPISYFPEKYPEIKTPYIPVISAQAAVVIDRNSQVPLFEKNSTFRFPPASTLKIMSALVALEHFKSEDIITINQENVEGTVLGIKSGESFRFEDLFYAMLLPSANDATIAIAKNYPGGEVAFVERMNQKAQEFNLQDTYFADSTGLDDDRNWTTPLDLARLGGIVLKNPVLAEAVAVKSREITSLEGNKYSLYNLNELLDYPGVEGIKTGHTDGAMDVLVTLRKLDNGQDLIFVVMRSEDRFGDTKTLLNYLNNNISYLSIHP